jgi:hypothetical protein
MCRMRWHHQVPWRNLLWYWNVNVHDDNRLVISLMFMPLASSKDIPAQHNQTACLRSWSEPFLRTTNAEFHDVIDNRVVSVAGRITHRRSLRRPLLRCHRPRDVRLFRFMITLTSSFTRTRSPGRLQPACHVRPCSVARGRWRGSRGVRHWLTGGRIHVRARCKYPAPRCRNLLRSHAIALILGICFSKSSKGGRASEGGDEQGHRQYCTRVHPTIQQVKRMSITCQ